MTYRSIRWIAQDKIDSGEHPGNTTSDTAELPAAKQRIAELETELAAAQRASELFAKDRVVRPKALYPIVTQLAVEGDSTKGVCRLLRIAPSGFFVERTRPLSPRQIRRAWLTDLVVQIWKRVAADLRRPTCPN